MVGCLDGFLYGQGQLRGQAKAQMHRGGQPGVKLAILRPDRGFYRAYHVTDHIFRRIMQKCRQLPARGNSRILPAEDFLNQKGMFGHRIGPVAPGLSVPARHEGQAMGDILDLDVHRGRVQQIQPATRQHALPGAGLFHRSTSVVETA